MIPNLFFYQLVLVALGWLCLMRQWAWPSDRVTVHFCPNPTWAYRSWVGWGNLRANGHPNGGPWRQPLCVACRRYFLETLGTLFHGRRASVELIVRVIACLAEGLGIRGTVRVCEVDANTVLQ